MKKSTFIQYFITKSMIGKCARTRMNVQYSIKQIQKTNLLTAEYCTVQYSTVNKYRTVGGVGGAVKALVHHNKMSSITGSVVQLRGALTIMYTRVGRLGYK